MSVYRVGLGYDVHRLAAKRPLVLGGVRIPFRLGLCGHSDADALLHAVCDALLGACGLPDIGELFPDSDPRYRGADSRDLLARVVRAVKARGYVVCNVDAVVIAQEPKLAGYKPAMRRQLSRVLGIKGESVGIQAKTNEGLGETGAKKAIACHAVALVRKGRAR